MTDAIRPRRSVLYVPGSNARALEKAKSLAADCLILDLEDSVAPDAKAEARRTIAEVVGAGGFAHQEVVIRVNALSSDWGAEDLRMAAAAPAHAVLVPKVSQPGDLAAVRAALAAASAPAGLALWAMMETPAGIINAPAICAAAAAPAHALEVLVMGTNDLAKETRAAMTAGRAPMLAWLSASVLAARAYGLDIIDGVYNNFQDAEGFRAECQHGRSLGMDGKTLIHPGQIGPGNEIFSPATAEVDWARRIIAAFEDPANAAKGVISLDGRMVERLHRDMARRTVAIADAIGARSPL
ncbi:MAG: CoA ester lyase [Hyphomicrobiaceae bacterium]